MIVQCCQCQRRYLLDENILGSKGKRVRCIGCGYIWKQTPPDFSKTMLIPHPQSIPTQKSAPKISPYKIGVVLGCFIATGIGLCVFFHRNAILILPSLEELIQPSEWKAPLGEGQA